MHVITFFKQLIGVTIMPVLPFHPVFETEGVRAINAVDYWCLLYNDDNGKKNQSKYSTAVPKTYLLLNGRSCAHTEGSLRVWDGTL